MVCLCTVFCPLSLTGWRCIMLTALLVFLAISTIVMVLWLDTREHVSTSDVVVEVVKGVVVVALVGTVVVSAIITLTALLVWLQ